MERQLTAQAEREGREKGLTDKEIRQDAYRRIHEWRDEYKRKYGHSIFDVP